MSAATNTANTSFVRADMAPAGGAGNSRVMSGDAGDLMSGLDSPSGRGSLEVVMTCDAQRGDWKGATVQRGGV